MGHIDLPDELLRLADAQVAAGRASSIEDVLRAGVAVLEREPQSDDAKMEKLRAAIDEGDASGVFEGDPFAEVLARYGLPATPR